MGLIYSSAESSKLMQALVKNTACGKETMTQLKNGSQHVIDAVDGHTLSGAAYTAGAGLFSELILPTISKVTDSFDAIEQEIDTYRTADRALADEGYLDEALLENKISSNKTMKAALDETARFVKQQARSNPLANVVDTLLGLQNKLNTLSITLQGNIDELEEKLQKLHRFSAATNGLFERSLSDLNLAMQGVLVLNDTKINEDGSYKLPRGTDLSWFKEQKSAAAHERRAYDQAIDELMRFDKDGLIEDIDAEKIKDWLLLFNEGNLTNAQIEALKTALLTIPGYLDRMQGAQELTTDILKKLAEFQDLVGFGWSVFGFAYDEERKHFYTKQDSFQSHFGFADIMDEFGPGLGMDLDTALVQFNYKGKTYRFQVWKGTYGAGTMVGGEQGWYVHDSKDWVQDGQRFVWSEVLGQQDWVPTALPADRIRMVNTLYNETTGDAITEISDTDSYDSKGAYWNLNTTSEYPGYTKSNIYTEGELYIDDSDLREIVFEQLQSNEVFSDIQIVGNRVTYTWKD